MAGAQGGGGEPEGRAAAPAASAVRRRRVGVLLGNAVTLVARAAFPLLRTLLAACGLLVILLLPLWIWLQAGVRLFGLDAAEQLTTGDIVKMVVVVGIPAVIVMVTVAL